MILEVYTMIIANIALCISVVSILFAVGTININKAVEHKVKKDKFKEFRDENGLLNRRKK